MDIYTRFLGLLFALTIVACIPEGAEDDDAPPTVGADAGGTESADSSSDVSEHIDDDASTQDATGDDAGAPPVEGVEVSHQREVRGVWIPTVYNMSWPSRAGLSADAQKRELVAQLEAAKDAGLNTVYFQVRAEADAFYPSQIEPWSRFLTGTMGRDPGYDPLELAIVEAHARGLELHAWMNPYRALATSDASAASADHIVHARPGIVVRYGSFHWMDPGLEAVRQQTLDVVTDVITRYDIDGLHFDDYFYPYPNGDPFPDANTYQAYQDAGGLLSLGDFRRNNVNLLVEAVHDLVQRLRPDIRFGISPFGIYRPGIPEGISGLDQYDAIYADPLRWLEGGWVDYLAPQLYWPTTQTAQAYGTLLDWWSARATEAGKDIYVGNFTNKLGMDAAWSVDELLEQVRLTRLARDKRALGNIHFHINPIQENRSGLTDALVREFYGAPAAPPPIPGSMGRPATPRLSVGDDGVTFEGSGEVRYLAVYQNGELIRLVPGVEGQFGLARGDYHISVIDRLDRESLAAPVTVTVDSAPAGESCVHSFGGEYAHAACSASYQCCDGTWLMGENNCGSCVYTEPTGETGCSP